MTQILRQSTAGQVVLLGPFIDDADFKTPETGLTIAATDIKLRKHGATALVDKNSGGATHIASGFYHATLDATDTNTAGLLDIVVAVSGALVVWARFEVLPAEVYDERVNADGPLPRLGILDQGTAQGATSTTVQLRSAATFADDSIIGAVIVVRGSTQGYWQVRAITDHVASTDTVTVSPAFSVTPSGTVAYKIFAAPPAVTASGSLPAVVAESLGTQARADVNGEVDSALADIHLDHLLANAYNPASKPGNAAGLLNAIVENDGGGVPRFTANVLEQISKTGYELSPAGIDAILDEIIEGSTTFRQLLRGFAAALLGKASGLATTQAKYRDLGDTKDRITATVDADGNRSAVTLDLS